MEKRVIVVCCVVGFLGLLSAAAGFAAEAKKFKGNQEVSRSECILLRSPASVLGFTAAVALMIAQIIINFAVGCRCCRKGSNRSTIRWLFALACSVLSWVTFGVSSFLLITGAVVDCFGLHSGVFAGGTAASLASVALGMLGYLASISGKDGNQSQGGVAMQSVEEGPAFVHQDTYTRRQLAGGGF